MTKKISVVLPVYNGEQYIEQALNTVHAQSMQADEIIIVDDGSTDNTQAILHKNEDSKIKIISQENAGVSAARNNAIRHATGELIAFLDVDDLWHPNKLETQTSFMQSGYYGLTYTKVVRIQDSQKKSKNSFKKFELADTSCKDIPIEQIIYLPYLTTSSVIVHREAYDAVDGFDEAFRTAEDQVFYLDIATKYKIGEVNAPLTHKCIVQNSLSEGAETYYDSLKALDRFAKLYPDLANYHKVVIRKARSRVYCELGSEMLWQRRLSEALQPILLSIKKNPTKLSLFLLMKYIYLSLFGIHSKDQ